MSEKNVFIDRHKKPDVIEDCKHFLQVINELEPCLVEFDKTGQMIPKVYHLDYEVGGDKRRPVIFITHHECTFSSNDGPRFG